MNRWIAGAHYGKDLFSGNAAVHEPDPIGLAVLVLDFFNKGPQRGFVGGIAAEHLVSQGQALRSDDQCNDDLHAVGAFITAVTESALVALRKARIKNSSSCICCHSSLKSQQPPHCRGRCNSQSLSHTS